ncbi:MAG: ROK family protein [Halobacteriaceae archaeon]
MVYAVALDIGATYTRVAIESQIREPTPIVKQKTPTSGTGESIARTITSYILEACEQEGIKSEEIATVGIGTTGRCNSSAGIIYQPPTFPEKIDEIPLGKTITSTFSNATVRIRNDGVTGAIAAMYETSQSNVGYITISSGIGGGFSIDGQIVTENQYNRSEIGHFMMDPSHPITCSCGIDGHWEAYCSGKNLPKYAQYIYESESFSTTLPVQSNSLEAPQIFANPDDPLARRVLEDFHEYNTIGVANCIHAYGSEIIVIGGGVARNNPVVIDQISDRIDNYLFSSVPKIESPSVKNPVLFGALIIAMKETQALDINIGPE